MNEIAQWGVVLFLTVMVVAAYRELGVILQPSRHTSDGIALGQKLPAAVRESVELDPDNDRVLVAVVSEGCSACARLLSGIERAASELQGSSLVLVAQAATERYIQALSRLPATIIDDRTGAISQQLNVHATPLVLAAGRDWRVFKKGVTHRIGDFLGSS